MASTQPTGKRSAFSPIAFDKVGDLEAETIQDHFIAAQPLSAITTSGVFNSKIGYTVTDEVGGATADVEVLAGEAGNPGIIRLNVGATDPADGDLVSLVPGVNDDVIKLDGSGVYLATKFRIPDVSDTVVQFGLVADPSAVPNSGADNVVSFVFDPEDEDNTGDAFFFAQINDAAGGDTEVIFSDVSYVEDDWVKLEIAADDTGATFRLTTEDGTQTANIELAVAATLTPVWQVENVGGAEESIEIDSFVLRYFERTGTEGLGA